jgi:hypothetical protein
MPVGKPSYQTKASEKYQRKAGYIAKTYKLKKDTVQEFADKCNDSNKSQASVITKLMKMYISGEIEI